MRKYAFFGISLTMLAAEAGSQTLDEAIRLTINEQFEKASSEFKRLIVKEPTNGNNYFYSGENYFYWEKLDSAKIMYKKGTEVNASNPLNYVGLGKLLWHNGKSAEAKSAFYKATTISQSKDANVFKEIAEAYINGDVKDINEALKNLSLAVKLNPKDPEIYLLTGDAYLENNDGNSAIKNYEKAAELNKKSVRAILRIGQLYNRARNYNLALDYYKKANDIDSSFAPAYREKAEIYFRAGQYKNAVAQYKRYLELNNDLTAKTRYVGFLVQSRQFADAMREGKEVMRRDSSNVYLYRYLGYAATETGDYTNGFGYMNHFFTKGANGARKICQDYEYMGKLYSKTGNDSIAILQYKKALEMDTSRKELLGDMAYSAFRMKKFEDAAGMYQKKIDCSENPSANDYFGLGRVYYFMKNFTRADSAFEMVARLSPEYPVGYLWRAKANVQLDPKNDKWLAKAHYEDYLSRIKPEETERNKKDIIEANWYIGNYHVAKKDYLSAKSYFAKMQELDPANKVAKDFFKSDEVKKLK